MKLLTRLNTAVFLVATVFQSGTVLAQSAVDDPTLSTKAAASKHATYTFENWKQVVHKWKTLNTAGLRLIDIEVLEHGNGKRYYSGTWTKGSGKYALYRLDSWSKFVDKWEQLNPNGYRLIDIERVKHGNKYWYYGVWRGGLE